MPTVVMNLTDIFLSFHTSHIQLELSSGKGYETLGIQLTDWSTPGSGLAGNGHHHPYSTEPPKTLAAFQRRGTTYRQPRLSYFKSHTFLYTYNTVLTR